MLNRAKEHAARERELQKVLMWPSSTSLKQILCKGGVSGTTDLTAKDVDRADILFEKASETVKGKMTATSMTKNIYPSKPEDIPSLAKCAKLYVDLFYVDKMTFLHTKSKPHNYITIQKLPSHKAIEIRKRLKGVLQKYIARGITITDVFGDN